MLSGEAQYVFIQHGLQCNGGQDGESDTPGRNLTTQTHPTHCTAIVEGGFHRATPSNSGSSLRNRAVAVVTASTLMIALFGDSALELGGQVPPLVRDETSRSRE